MSAHKKHGRIFTMTRGLLLIDAPPLLNRENRGGGKEGRLDVVLCI